MAPSGRKIPSMIFRKDPKECSVVCRVILFNLDAQIDFLHYMTLLGPEYLISTGLEFLDPHPNPFFQGGENGCFPDISYVIFMIFWVILGGNKSRSPPPRQ